MNNLKLVLTFIIAFLLSISVFATVNLTTTVTNNKCYNGTAGAIAAVATGGSSGLFEYRLATGPAAGWQSSGTFSALAAGTYPLSARDKNNTSDVATTFVTVNQPTSIAVSSSITNTSCAASSDGKVTLNVSGGTSPYTYTWLKNRSTLSGATASSIVSLTPGVYNAIVTDANGCQQQLTNASSTAIVPLTLTGFTQDVIADGTNTSTSTNNTVKSPMDLVLTSGGKTTFGGSNLYANGYQTITSGTTLSTNGLPITQSITSTKDNTHKFVFADFGSSNDLYLNGVNSTGTLTIASANVAPFQTLYLLTTSCNSQSTVKYTVNYSDNTTDTGRLTITDWAGGTADTATTSLGRVYYSKATSGTSTINAGTKDGQGNIFYLYDLPISIPVNTKNVVSVSFTNTTGTQANLFAITGSTSSVGVSVAAGGSSSTTPSVAISPAPSNLTYCSGESFTFNANPTNGGASPSYVWTVGGVTQSNTTSTLTAAITGTGSKIIGVTMNVTDTNATCLTAQTATKTITLSSGSVTPTVSISGPSSICQGNGTTYIASSTNGGLTPTYSWYVNNSVVSGATDSVFTNTLTATGSNSVYAKITSSTSCALTNPATSNIVYTTLASTVTPSVAISSTSSKSGSITTVAFAVSSSANLGSSPSYQWYLNGNPISGATSSTYSVNNPVSTDLYSLATTSSATCPNNAQVMSNYININAALPITLAWFKAALTNDNKVAISWLTTTEYNVKTFEVQRSQNPASNFITVGTVAATNKPSGSSYGLLDTLNANGDYFYRLKSTDIDGTFTYSDIASVTYNKGTAAALMVYPNPFSNTLTLHVLSTQSMQNAGITLYSITGQALYTVQKSIYPGSQTINLEGLENIPTGVYILKLTGAGIVNNGIKVIKK